MVSGNFNIGFAHAILLLVLTAPPDVALADNKQTPQLSEKQIQAYKQLFKQDAQDVLKTMDRWAKSWVYQKIDAYLDCYSPDYIGKGFSTHDAWEANRRRRFQQQTNIEIAISNMQVLATEQNEFVIRFEQTYHSDTYNDRTLKEIILHKINDNWRIVSENVVKNL